MRITLNLATRPFADLGPAIKRLRIAMGVLILIAICLGLGLRALHQKAEEARARDHSLDGEIARIAQERQEYQNLMRQPANEQLLKQTDALNHLFDEKAFSWTLAMEDLETVLPGGVQVSTIEPVRAKDGHITLHLRVIGPRDRAIELVRNLEHSRRFLLPRIVGENAEATGGPNERLEPVSASNRFDFDLLAEYNPAAPGERRPARTPETAPAAGNPAIHPALVRPASGLVQRPGRPPYTGSPQPVMQGLKPNPALYPHRTPGGPQ
jgi:type IV pilus assembly protein PilN